MNLKEEFVKRFGGDEKDIRIFTSPGRVNLIGEHTDYNGGFVFPAAIELGTFLAVRERNDNIIRMAATDLDCVVEADIHRIEDYKTLPWGNYQLGVASELIKDGYTVSGLDMLYHDTLPHGGGLSSSAAIEVVTALCFATLSNEKTGKGKVDMAEMAKIGQRAENNYIGVSCGIMDQFASAMGKKDHAIFLDCKDLSYKHVPLDMKGFSIVITNTNKKRSLITSKFNERRSECEKGLEILKNYIKADCLGEISSADFDAYKDKIEDETIRKRVEHVINECERTKKSVTVLSEGNLKEFGRLMNASHDSLRDLYEVTGAELDAITDAARQVDGCIGSRMTGAGFGGCNVSIVKDDAVEEFEKFVEKEYTEKIGYAPSFYVTKAGDGGREL